jgi:hypothetical protein
MTLLIAMLSIMTLKNDAQINNTQHYDTEEMALRKTAYSIMTLKEIYLE